VDAPLYFYIGGFFMDEEIVPKLKTTKRKKKVEDYDDFDLLYQYVKKDVLGYEDNFNLPKYMIYKLKEMETGRMYANTTHTSKYSYTYKEILETFKEQKSVIDKAFIYNTFENEKHKFSYAMAIVKNSINDFIIGVRNAEKQKLKVENEDVEFVENVKAEYKKTDKKINSRLNDLMENDDLSALLKNME
jgi:hypothetical protein